MEIGELVKEYREKNGLSQRQFSKISGISNGYISMIEEGKNPKTGEALTPSLATLKKLAIAMKMSLNDLMSLTEDSNVMLSFDNISPVSTQRIPMLGEIACGQPLLCNEDHESYIETNSAIKADFCLRCKGDSMTGARIYDGDIVFVHQQEIVENGQIAAVAIGNEATLKRVFYYPEKAKLVLQAENPKYEPLVFVNEELNEVHILGLAIMFQSTVR